jgi:hypothetical protein
VKFVALVEVSEVERRSSQFCKVQFHGVNGHRVWLSLLRLPLADIQPLQPGIKHLLQLRPATDKELADLKEGITFVEEWSC